MQIKDSLLLKTDFKNIQETVMSNDFPFYFQNKVAFEGDKNFYFTHELFHENGTKSKFFNLIIPLLNQLNISTLLRVKINCFPSTEKIIKYKEHTDFPFKHNGAIFYINTNNGHTILEDGTKIESVENRMLFFDPSKKHKSTNCTDAQYRMNINFNYMAMDY